MRRYYLASTEDRSSVDLRDYRQAIIEAVHTFAPNAQVEVHEQYYTVHPTPDRGNAIRIGRVLSDRNVLGRYCVKIPKLFCSEEIKGKKGEDNGTQKRPGGHR